MMVERSWGIPANLVTAGVLLLVLGSYRCRSATTFFDLPNARGPVAELTQEQWSQIDPRTFAQEYATGWGKPVILRGMAKEHPAYQKWSTDDQLVAEYGSETVEVEMSKKEDRDHKEVDMSLSDFVEKYKAAEVYSVTEVPERMRQDIIMFDLFRYSQAYSFLYLLLFWWSSGGTESVVHNDPQDNLNCVIAGKKRFAMFHPARRDWIESRHACGWVDTESDEFHALRPNSKAYGSYGGQPFLNQSDLDLELYPTWAKLEWWDAQLEAGDCFFLPSSWYHHVYTEDGQRSIAVNMWWWRHETEEDEKTEECPSDGLTQNLTAAECSFGYENSELIGYDGVPYGIEKVYEERTSCARGMPKEAPIRPSARVTSFKKWGIVRPRSANGEDFVELEEWLGSVELAEEVERCHNRAELRAALKAKLHDYRDGDEVSNPLLAKVIQRWTEFQLRERQEGGEGNYDGLLEANAGEVSESGSVEMTV